MFTDAHGAHGKPGTRASAGRMEDTIAETETPQQDASSGSQLAAIAVGSSGSDRSVQSPDRTDQSAGKPSGTPQALGVFVSPVPQPRF